MIVLISLLVLCNVTPPDTLDKLVADLATRLEREGSLADGAPLLALNLEGERGMTEESRRLLRTAIASRLEQTGRYRIARETAVPLHGLETNPPGFRESLRRDGITAALNLRITARGSRVFLTCRFIAAASAEEDNFFSIEHELTPDLVALLQAAETNVNQGMGQARLVYQMIAPSGSLAVAAFDQDGDGADELVLVTPRAAHFFSWAGDHLEATGEISLTDVPTASYVTRRPAAHAFSANEELYIAGTPWQAGFALSRHSGAIKHLSAQPLAASPAGFLLGDSLLPGEDNYSGDVHLRGAVGENGQAIKLPSFRFLEPVGGASPWLIIAADGAAWTWDGARTAHPAPPLPGIPRATCSAGDIWPGIIFVAVGEGDSPAQGSAVQALRFADDRWSVATRFPASLDIADMAIYNPGGLIPGIVAALGRDERGIATLALFALPATMSWSTR